MAIVKYNPLRELRSMQNQMDRLLDLSWGGVGEFTGEDIKEGSGNRRWISTRLRIPL